jgi:hypothetical protein
MWAPPHPCCSPCSLISGSGPSVSSPSNNCGRCSVTADLRARFLAPGLIPSGFLPPWNLPCPRYSNRDWAVSFSPLNRTDQISFPPQRACRAWRGRANSARIVTAPGPVLAYLCSWPRIILFLLLAASRQLHQEDWVRIYIMGEPAAADPHLYLPIAGMVYLFRITESSGLHSASQSVGVSLESSHGQLWRGAWPQTCAPPSSAVEGLGRWYQGR